MSRIILLGETLTPNRTIRHVVGMFSIDKKKTRTGRVKVECLLLPVYVEVCVVVSIPNVLHDLVVLHQLHDADMVLHTLR